jgi:Fe-S-cluster containining protein
MRTSDPVNYADPQMCRQCRGLCCQGHPGVWVDPDRFFKAFDLPKTSSPETLRSLLPRELLLRDLDGVAIPAPQKQQSGCIFLDSEGCQLPENRRPDQCLALVPALETLVAGEIRCELKAEGSTLAAITAWRNYWCHR